MCSCGKREAELVGRDRSGDGHDAGRHRRSSFGCVGPAMVWAAGASVEMNATILPPVWIDEGAYAGSSELRCSDPMPKLDLLKGTLPLLVLSVLRDGELYGYEIAQRIRSRSGELFAPSEGSLYPRSIGSSVPVR